jgi:AAHS family 4-hydroxybenzoate transporter-like MFS transporter
MSAVAPAIDLTPIIDRQKVGALHLKLIIIGFLVVMVDGYDIGAAAFAAPALVREWHVAPQALGGMFSAGLIAGFIGPLCFGWISDHFGRRTAIVGGAFFFGLFTLASVLAQNLGTLIALRFIAGIGISGVLPITVALTNEYAPRRMRATLFVLMFCGVTFGGGLPGLVAARFMATHGWQILFWIGGIAPMVVAVLVYFLLPESIKFLSLHRERHSELVRNLAVMDPALRLDPKSSFTIGGEENREKFSYTAIFHGRLAWITPMFWLSNAVT